MNSTTYKAIRFHQPGDVSVLNLEDLPLQQPNAHQVRVRIAAIGLNRAEVMFRKDQYFESPRYPSGLGYEASGVIDAIGFGHNGGANGLSIGDKVSIIPCFSMRDYSVYGQSAIVPAYAVTAYPSHLSAMEAAAIWMPYITAWGALIDTAQLKSSDTVLITAASSSVGCGAIQIAKAAGATVIATTTSAEKVPFIEANGADHVINTQQENLVNRVMQITQQRGANVIFDPIAGPGIHQLAQAAAQRAIIFEYGALDSRPTPYPLQISVAKGLSVRGYNMFEIVTNGQAIARAKKYIFSGLQSGLLRPQIDHRQFTLEQMRQAHQHMESNQQQGKIVIRVNGT